MANTAEEQLREMYGAQLKSQNEQLTNDYNTAVSNLDVQKEQNQQTTDANLNRTAAESKKRAMADAEYYAAAGLTSGAKAQARMARDNQLMTDMATIRAAQQTADAEIERQRGLLAQEYDSAIRQAQANNDLALAQALYDQAQSDEAQLLSKQQNAASLMASAGDFSLYGQLYGLTPDQIAALKKQFELENAEAGAVPEGYLTAEQVAALIAQALAEAGIVDETVTPLPKPGVVENGNLVVGAEYFTPAGRRTATGGNSSAEVSGKQITNAFLNPNLYRKG